MQQYYVRDKDRTKASPNKKGHFVSTKLRLNESLILIFSTVEPRLVYLKQPVFRTYSSFENQLKKGIMLNPTEYVLPPEICAMVNVVLGKLKLMVKCQESVREPDQVCFVGLQLC